MKKGVNAWCFPGSFTIDQILEGAEEVGYEGVELNIDEDELNPYRVTKKERREIAGKAASLGLKLPSVCTALHWKYNLAGADEALRKKGIEIIRKGCEFASDIGAKTFLVVPANASPEVSYKKMWELSKKGILEAAPTAADTGVYIGVENVGNRFLYSPLEFKAFIDEINNEYVKVYFDIGNCLVWGFPQQWIEILGADIVCVHVKDFDIQKREYRPLLQGNVDWRAVVAAFRKVRYDYFLNVEVEPYPGHPTKSAADNKSALDIILGTYCAGLAGCSH